MKLIIAEKPMLARAIAAAIPGEQINKDGYAVKGDYTIISAFGHLLTLKDPEDYDEKYKRWAMETLPIFFEDWGKKPGEGKEERLNLIGELLKSADCVIHAGDPDDEGQYLIDEILQWFSYKGPVYRLATGDTTQGALTKALANMKDNKEFVNSGLSAHARAVADIMTGYNFSRYFTLQNSHIKMLTVGRVQTPALGLVVQRDMLIENHEKQGYFTINATLNIDGKKVNARFEPAKDDPNLEEGRITDSEYAGQIAAGLKGKNFPDTEVSCKAFTEQPPLPFNLVKLQSYCSGKFGYDPSQTLAITQSLRDNYNAITYNRSDCQYLSEEQYKESAKTIRQVMENLKADPAGGVFEKLPIDASLHSQAFNDKNITAHTAIIPQNKRFDISKLTEEERNVYLAIVKYYMAQFLQAAKKERSSVEIQLEEGKLKASSVKVLSPGYMVLIKPEKKKPEDEGESEAAEGIEEENETALSQIEAGTYNACCEETEISAKETKAPPRYTKASLNEDMTRIAKYVTDPKAKALLLAKDKDKKGENGSIGTSATRSGIIDTLEERGYIECKGKKIRSTVLGRELYRILPPELKKPDMTGYWWAIQQQIQDGEAPWTALTDSVLETINKVIHTEYPKVDAYHIPENMRRGKLLLGKCPRCGKDIIEGKLGFGCSGYDDGCRFVIWKTTDRGMMQKIDVTADMVHTLLEEGWASEGEGKRTKNCIYSKKLYSESKGKRYPGNIYLFDNPASGKRAAGFMLQEIVNEPPKSLGKCPRCGGDVIEGREGYGCANYKEGCKFVIWKKAKSGFMSKTKITAGLVRKFLKSNWVDETKEGVPTGKKRTETELHIKKLYSERKQAFYTGDVYLTDEGPESKFGAGFGIARFTDDGPEVLGKCPRCGKDIVESDKGYGCTGFKDGCRFMIWKNQKQVFLSKVTFTKTDAKKFLAGKTAKKSKLVDKKGKTFTAELIMDERPDNPFGPVFRVVDGTIEVKDGDPAEIKIDTVSIK